MEPPSWVTNEQQWRTHCRKVRARSRDLLEGRLGVIAAAREFATLGFWVRAQEDPDFTTFTAIDSQTDALPVGSPRSEWAPDALAKKDKEIRELEARWREQALSAARNLLEKYTERPNQAIQRTAGRSDVELVIATTFYSQPRAFSPAVADLGSR